MQTLKAVHLKKVLDFYIGRPAIFSFKATLEPANARLGEMCIIAGTFPKGILGRVEPDTAGKQEVLWANCLKNCHVHLFCNSQRVLLKALKSPAQRSLPYFV